jgi:hypothetical protein
MVVGVVLVLLMETVVPVGLVLAPLMAAVEVLAVPVEMVLVLLALAAVVVVFIEGGIVVILILIRLAAAVVVLPLLGKKVQAVRAAA